MIEPLDTRLAYLITNFLSVNCPNKSRETKLKILESACNTVKAGLPKKSKADIIEEIAKEANEATLAHLQYGLARACEKENQPYDVEAYKTILKNTIDMLSKGLKENE